MIRRPFFPYFGNKEGKPPSPLLLAMEKIFKRRIFGHLLFWVVMLIITAYYGSLFGGTFYRNLTSLLFLMPLQIIAAYLLVYIQIPKWLYMGKWMTFLISFVIVGFLAAIIARLVVLHIAEPLTSGEVGDESVWQIIADPIYLISVYIPTIYLPAAIFFLIKLTIDRFAERRKFEELLKEKKTAELNFLKSQTNPHFLFNTLNNIYALSKKKSPHTPEMILKLSEILDYTLYDCDDATVPIIKEWELIENYAELSVLRYSQNLELQMQQDLDNDEEPIAPLILIALVENAFKYCFGGDDYNPRIQIKLTLLDHKLNFEVFNTTALDGSQPKKRRDKGIGVKNVNSQLQLLYPNNHHIEVTQTVRSYNVNLTISL